MQLEYYNMHPHFAWRAEEMPHLRPGSEVYPELDRLPTTEHAELAQRPTPPKPTLDASSDLLLDTYSSLHDKRLLFVGAGAGAIVLGAYMTMRGARAENMTFIDPKGIGGIWQEQWVQHGGFNNPAPLVFNDDHRLKLTDRSGANMHNFLQNIANDYLGAARKIRSTAVDIRQRRYGWLGFTADNQYAAADYVILGTGQSEPRRIDGPRISSNLDSLVGKVGKGGITVERYQRKLTEEEFASGRPIVLIGLGNSTAAMLHAIQTYEDEHNIEIDYTVLTDLPYSAVANPNQAASGRQKPVFRQPKAGYLTGYSGDLPRDRRTYLRALHEDRIMTGVREIKANRSGTRLVASDSWFERRYFDSEPIMFALLGYERDTRIFKAAGCLATGWNKQDLKHPRIRLSDGAVQTKRHDFRSNIFAIGSCAAGNNNPNAAVLPGIFGQVPSTALTIGMRSQKG